MPSRIVLFRKLLFSWALVVWRVIKIRCFWLKICGKIDIPFLINTVNVAAREGEDAYKIVPPAGFRGFFWNMILVEESWTLNAWLVVNLDLVRVLWLLRLFLLPLASWLFDWGVWLYIPLKRYDFLWVRTDVFASFLLSASGGCLTHVLVSGVRCCMLLQGWLLWLAAPRCLIGFRQSVLVINLSPIEL